MVKKTTTKISKVHIAKSIRKADGELSTNEENISRMMSGTSIADREKLDFGDNYPKKVQQKLTEIELEIFRSEAGVAALRKFKIIKRLQKIAEGN